MEVLEAIKTLRSVRRFASRPVEEEKLRLVLEAASMAPSASNLQPWRFVVVRRPELKRKIGEVVVKTWRPVYQAALAKGDDKMKKLYGEADYLVGNTENAPVLIFACIDLERTSKSEEARYASLYPAVQNLMLAAWSQGFGTCMTTHGSTPSRGEAEVKELLGIPENVKIGCLIYMGYPESRPAPPKRIPVNGLIHHDGW